ncbi:MAG: hypothetical protein ACK5AZ_17950 [Bryobacteraceae bacterium]
MRRFLSICVNSIAALAVVCGGQVQAQQAGAGKVAQGAYECWANGEARLLMNFTIVDGSRYTGSEGEMGTYSFDPASKRITFQGGSLDGAMPDGFYAIYHEPKGVPTVSFRSRRDAEAAFCENAKKK